MKNSGYNLLVELMIVLVIVFIMAVIGLGVNSVFNPTHEFKGEILNIEQLENTYVESDYGSSTKHNFSINVDTGKENVYFSAEDRKWATVKEGQYVTVKCKEYIFGVKKGQFFQGRLIKIHKR